MARLLLSLSRGLRRWLRGTERLEVVHHVLDVPVSGQGPPELRVVFASDFHAGKGSEPKDFSVVRQAIEQARPDVLLLGGDYVCSDARGMQVLVAELVKLTSPKCRFAVMGDHDTRSDPTTIGAELARAGFTLLINQRVVLPAPFADFWIAGLDDVRFGNPDPAALSDGADGIGLILAHSPAAWELVQRHRFRALFCGHTHGGQIALPGRTPIYLPEGIGCRRFAAGRFELGTRTQPRTLVVSRGIGCSVVPVRLFAPPDIQICDLRPIPQH